VAVHAAPESCLAVDLSPRKAQENRDNIKWKRILWPASFLWPNLHSSHVILWHSRDSNEFWHVSEVWKISVVEKKTSDSCNNACLSHATGYTLNRVPPMWVREANFDGCKLRFWIFGNLAYFSRCLICSEL
jgi:hypothetical protein